MTNLEQSAQADHSNDQNTNGVDSSSKVYQEQIKNAPESGVLTVDVPVEEMLNLNTITGIFEDLSFYDLFGDAPDVSVLKAGAKVKIIGSEPGPTSSSTKLLVAPEEWQSEGVTRYLLAVKVSADQVSRIEDVQD